LVIEANKGDVYLHIGRKKGVIILFEFRKSVTLVAYTYLQVNPLDQ